MITVIIDCHTCVYGKPTKSSLHLECCFKHKKPVLEKPCSSWKPSGSSVKSILKKSQTAGLADTNRDDAFHLYFDKIHKDMVNDEKFRIDMYNVWNAAFSFITV